MYEDLAILGQFGELVVDESPESSQRFRLLVIYHVCLRILLCPHLETGPPQPHSPSQYSSPDYPPPDYSHTA